MFIKQIKQIIVLLLITLLIVLFIFLLVVSTGKLKQKRDENGVLMENSISKKVKITINGVEQGMFIVGENKDNPVLLFLHGGPGTPEYVYFYKCFENLEKEFTVCYWDQRGSGMSFHFNMPDITVEDLVEDTKEVSVYLINTFSKEKIYLLGHSWGTFLGIKTIEKYPDFFEAYIAVSQVSNQFESEKLAYNYFIEKNIEEGNRKIIKELKKINTQKEEFAVDAFYIIKHKNKFLKKYGIGTTYQKPYRKQMVKNFVFFKGYTLIEKIKSIMGVFKSMKQLGIVMIKTNLMENDLNFEIPIYIIQGAFDYKVSYQLCKEYYELIDAPKKEFITFDSSAHCPFYEEQDKFAEVIKKIKRENERE